MRLCPIRRALLSSGRLLEYTTSYAVPESKRAHGEMLSELEDAFEEVVMGHDEVSLLGKLPDREYCLSFTTRARGRVVQVCGRPDAVYFLRLRCCNELQCRDEVNLIIEATLSPSVRHVVCGEMLFYLLAVNMYYGIKVAALLATPRRIYLLAPALVSLHNVKYSVAWSLAKLITGPSELSERVVEKAEELREKKPWACNLCDIKHVCPLGYEV
jgi:hypothetical protein